MILTLKPLDDNDTEILNHDPHIIETNLLAKNLVDHQLVANSLLS